MEDTKFSRVYSAKINSEVEQIRERYLPRVKTDFERLCELDMRVRSAGVVEGLTLGVIGALLIGIGMCFGLDILPGANWITLVFCSVGIDAMLPAYSVFRYIARKTKAELAPEILKLSNEILERKRKL